MPTQSSDPASIAAGPDGALWFAEYAGNRIGRISLAGAVSEYPVPTLAGSPLGITAGPDGALWFTETGSDKIGRISTSGNFSEYPVPTGGTRQPLYIAVGADGALWFTELQGNKIGRITTGGALSEYPTPLVTGNPYGIAAGPDDALWFTGIGGSSIGRITTAGVISTYSTSVLFNEPLAITAGADGALWFTDINTNQIGRITIAGVLSAYRIPTASSVPGNITAGPDGALWFTESNQIGRITTAGVVSEYPIPTANSDPGGLTAGPGGALWFTERSGNKVGQAILRTSQTITFAPLSDQTLGIAPFPITATASSGLAVSFTSNTTAVCTISATTVALIGAGTCSITATQRGNATFAAATPVTQSFTVGAAVYSPQSITFGVPGNVTVGAAPFPITATASSGLAVSLTSNTTAVCTISGTTVTLVAAGTCSITATQSGNATFAAATPVTQSFTVNPAGSIPQTITFGVLGNVTLGVAPFPIAATASSGLPVSFSSITPALCSVSGSTVTVFGAGLCSITATQLGNAVYGAATPVTRSFTITVIQTITFTTPVNFPYGPGPFTVGATATSGLPVSFASNTPSVCTVSGATVTIVAGGSCPIVASQAGNSNFAPAAPATRIFTVGWPSLAITVASSVNPANFGHPVTLTAMVTPSTATGTVTFYDGTSVLGTQALIAGQAVFTTIQLASGARSLKAVYSGDATHGVSISAGLAQAVNANPQSGFQAAVNYAAGSEPLSVAIGDFNGDGRSDLAVVNFTGGTVSVLIGNGDGTFQTAVNYAVGIGPESVAVGDFNGDGKADLAVASFGDLHVTGGSGSLDILLGNGDGTFQTTVAYGVALSPRSVVVADFNGDGKADVILADWSGAGGYGVNVVLGNGDGTFQNPVVYGDPRQPDAVAVTDLNGDGNADVVFANFGGGTVTALIRSPVVPGSLAASILNFLSFQTPVDYLVGENGTSIATGDFNGDGKADVAFAHYIARTGSAGGVSVLLGKGDGTFQTAVTYPAGGGPSSVAVGDFDGDGKTDLAVTNHSDNNLSVLFGNGDGTFKAAVNYPAGTNPWSVAVGDFNGDGRADLAIANFGSNNVSILLGNRAAQTITFAAPAAVTLPSPSFLLIATASSGLSVSFASTTTSNCSVSGSTVTPLAAGMCTITAVQAGNTNYASAAPVTRSFTINPASGGGGGGGGGGGFGGGGGILTASPAVLTLNVPVNVPGTLPVTLSYTNTFKGAPVLQTNVTTANQGIAWLTVSPGSGTMTQASFDGTTYTYTVTVTITADATRFGPGNSYGGTVNFTAADGTASTSVTMKVTDPAKFTVSPPSPLIFTYRQGDLKTPAVQSLSVSSTPSGLTFPASASTTSGRGWLSVPATSGITPGLLPVSVNVANLTPGSYAGKVTISSGAGSVDEQVTLTIIPANAPVITPGGIGPVYSASTSIQAGSWISIYGSNLADASVVWNGDFATSLGGVSITVNGKPAYLWYVSPTQINVQAPDDDATSTVAVVVTNSHGSFTSTATLATASPSFSLLDGTHAAGVILTPGGTGAYGGGVYDLVGPAEGFSFDTRPVKPGEILELFGVGFGPTNPLVPAGQVFSGQAPTAYPVTITIGGMPAAVSYAGLTEAGLYQLNLTVPNVGGGDQALQATVNGVQTQPGPVVTIQ